MVRSYTIEINNNTGSPQNYALISEKPQVTGPHNSTVWSNVCQTAVYCPHEGNATFETNNSYFGIVGTWRGGAKDGASVTVTQSKEVTLGTVSADGSQNRGTSLRMVVMDGQSPSFDNSFAPPSAFVNAFQVDTGNDFTLQTAIENSFFVGVGNAFYDGSTVPLATFRPEPRCRYQIQPSNSFYISFGDPMQVGQMVDLAKMRQPLRIDFNNGPNVTVNHTPTGQLVIAR
ncbi:hypothetical protein FBEOM_10470 [Fusarium beomiforme]|uniref:Uncharacterized protein n=1 Tax=Fusarium beomiforme TaxID=44412 RepID=A0A9P5AB87_9HYPO|nr:hypothetical protein FBEOM_10470 [Fusarium beomiforme]